MEIIGALAYIGFLIGCICAFFWALNALSQLKRGQREILERLDAIAADRNPPPSSTPRGEQ